MKKLLIGLLAIVSISAIAGENILAKDLSIGTEFKVLKDINFSKQTTLTRVQKGIISIDVNSSNAYCDISMMDNSYNYSTGYVDTIKEGTVFKLRSHHDSDMSKGSTGFFLDSSDGRELHLQCRRGVTLSTRLTDYLGLYDLNTDNVIQLRVNKMKRILNGVLSF